MHDIRERFSVLDQISVPDLREDVGRRGGGPVRAPLPGLSRARRVLIAVVALSLAAGSVFVLHQAFGQRTPQPEGSPLPGVTHRPSPSHQPKPTGAASPKSTSIAGVRWLLAHDLGEVDPQPTSILAAFGHLWVTGFTGGGPHVTELDAVTGAMIRRIPVGAVPSWEVGGGGMVTNSGAVWVGGLRYSSHMRTSLLSAIDPDTGTVRDYTLPGHGVLDITTDGTIMYALVSIDSGLYAVVLVDPPTGNVIRTVPFPATWSQSVVALDGAVWVSERGPKGSCCLRLVPVIPAPGTDPVTVPLSAVRGAGPDVADGILWAPVKIAHGTSPWSGLAQIDPLTGRIVKQWDLGEGVAFDLIGIGNGAWVLEGSPCCADVVRLDAAGGRSTVGAHTLGQDPIALAADARNVWALTYEGHVLRVASAG